MRKLAFDRKQIPSLVIKQQLKSSLNTLVISIRTLTCGVGVETDV